MHKKISIFDHVGEKAGMDYYSSSLAKGFISQKCSCTIYSNFVGIEPDRICYKMYYTGHTKSNSILKLFSFLIATIKSSFDARKKKSELVIVHLFSANLVTLFLIMIPKLFGLKTAVISHDVSSFVDNDNILIQNLIYNTFSNYIIVHNQFSYDELLKNIKLTDHKKVTVIKHGGYLDHISERPSIVSVRKQLGLDTDGKYILFFGQIKEVKGLDILLKAMCKVSPDIKLIIAGKPWKADFSTYDELIEKYQLSDRIVKMIRFIEDDEREKLFFAADVNVLPYRIIYQSGVLLMAMSHGLPVIASDLPANKEIIEDGVNGLLFESENFDALAKAIEEFFNSDEQSVMLASNAFLTIQNDYDWAEISRLYIDILKVDK